MIARRFAAWLLAATAALLLTACSTADFGYRNARLLYDHADTWLLWSVDDYLDLTASQKDFARRRLAQALAWHRRNALPQYARFLSDLEQQVDVGLTAEALEADRERLRRAYRDMAEHLLPDAADLFAMLDPAQVDDLARRLDRADRKVLEEAAAARKRGIARTIEHLEAWTGKLSHAQRELVQERMAAFPETSRQRVAEWRLRQGRLVELMRARLPRAEMVAALDALLFDVDAWRDPAYARAVHERDDGAIAMVAELARTLTPEQVAHIKQRVRGLQADIADATRGS